MFTLSYNNFIQIKHNLSTFYSAMTQFNKLLLSNETIVFGMQVETFAFQNEKKMFPSLLNKLKTQHFANMTTHF